MINPALTRLGTVRTLLSQMESEDKVDSKEFQSALEAAIAQLQTLRVKPYDYQPTKVLGTNDMPAAGLPFFSK